MPFHRRNRGSLEKKRALALFLALLAALPALAAKPPAPAVRLPLSALGFPGYRVALMHAGASMATLHLLDRNHLLFTFGLRSLVPRLPGDGENDQDRLVGAEVIEIPTGKILERTEWHLHDHGRYLWSVGHGVFVLRSGDDLSTFAPLRGLASHTSFDRTALPHRPGHPELITGSPDGQILTVELQKRPDADELANGDHPKLRHTTLEFYRVVAPAEPDQPVELRAAGAVGSPGLLRLALDGDGYLWADDKPHSRWSVSFNEFEGKGQDLAAVDSSCAPRLELLSRGEFAVLSCTGSEESQMLSAYGFDGHENWRERLHGDGLQPPTIVHAPEWDRFAKSRLTASSSGSTLNTPGLDDGTLSQEIRVYSTGSGDLLLSLQCMPVLRTPENFDISADGRTLALLGTESINLYSLPELTARDRKDLAEAQTMTPPVSHAPVVLRRITRPVVAEEQAIASEETTAPQPAAPPAEAASGNPTASTEAAARAASHGTSSEAAPPTTASSGGASGDPVDAPRKPPTLLGPGEVQEYKGHDNKPQ